MSCNSWDNVLSSEKFPISNTSDVPIEKARAGEWSERRWCRGAKEYRMKCLEVNQSWTWPNTVLQNRKLIFRSCIHFLQVSTANYHKHGGLKRPQFIILQFCRSEVPVAPLGALFGVFQGQSKMSPGLVLTRRLWRMASFQTPLGYWPNPVPCGCRTEVPASLVLCAGHLPALLRHAHIFSHASR